jgi:heptosyltransferase-2
VLRPAASAHRHQAWEYVGILGLAAQCSDLPAPRLLLPAERLGAVRERLGLGEGQEAVGLVPGAARGPSKQWPPAYFAEVGRQLRERFGCRLYVFGATEEQAVCSEVAERASAVNMAGRTSVSDLASMLGTCRVVVGNDSGAGHLAGAVGTPVVTVFGITDPQRTRPLGEGHRVVSAEGARKSRDVPPCSPEAARRLSAVAPERVFRAAADLFETDRPRRGNPAAR